MYCAFLCLVLTNELKASCTRKACSMHTEFYIGNQSTIVSYGIGVHIILPNSSSFSQFYIQILVGVYGGYDIYRVHVTVEIMSVQKCLSLSLLFHNQNRNLKKQTNKQTKKKKQLNQNSQLQKQTTSLKPQQHLNTIRT